MFLQTEVAPALSPWLHPGFLFPAAIVSIGFIAWLIRLESKVNGVEKSQVKLEQRGEDTHQLVESHRSNAGIHFDQRLAAEVERRQTDRMDRMQGDIREIKDIVKEMASR